MSRTWYYCQTCETTHPETSPGTGLLVCPYCSGTAVTLVPRSDIVASLRDGTRTPSELKATCADRTSGGDQSIQANIRLTGERPIFRPLTKT